MRTFTSRRAAKQAGFSLVEMMLVIGLIISIAIGAFIIYPIVRLSNDVKEASDRTVLVISQIKDFFGTQPYTGLTSAAAIDSGILTDADLETAWGTITVQSQTEPHVLEVVLNSVPSAACQRILPQMAQMSAQLAVQNVVVKRNATLDTQGPVVVFDPTTAVTQCNAGATRDVHLWVE